LNMANALISHNIHRTDKNLWTANGDGIEPKLWQLYNESEEALAIGLLSALRHENDIAGAMTFAANHGGNSNTTAAIAGTLVGARIGFNAIPDRFVDRLELVDVILELADDVTTDCPMSDWGPSNPVWEHKYIYEDYAYWRRRTPEAKEAKEDEAGQTD